MTLKKIAKITRTVVEMNCLGNDNIAGWHDLSGACGYASYGLYRMLPGSELVIGTYNGIGHAWVELEEKIIDITATQFAIRDKIYIVKKGGNRASLYHPKTRGRPAVISLGRWGYPDGWREPLVRQLKKEVGNLTV